MNVISNLVEAMNASTLRHRVLSHNVANAETPYFRRFDLRFDQVLHEELGKESGFVGRKTDERHLDIGQAAAQSFPSYSVMQEKGITNLNARSNVDIDYEMTSIAENALWYQTLVQQTNHYLNQYRRIVEAR